MHYVYKFEDKNMAGSSPSGYRHHLGAPWRLHVAKLNRPHSAGQCWAIPGCLRGIGNQSRDNLDLQYISLHIGETKKNQDIKSRDYLQSEWVSFQHANSRGSGKKAGECGAACSFPFPSESTDGRTKLVLCVLGRGHIQIPFFKDLFL